MAWIVALCFRLFLPPFLSTLQTHWLGSFSNFRQILLTDFLKLDFLQQPRERRGPRSLQQPHGHCSATPYAAGQTCWYDLKQCPKIDLHNVTEKSSFLNSGRTPDPVTEEKKHFTRKSVQ